MSVLGAARAKALPENTRESITVDEYDLIDAQIIKLVISKFGREYERFFMRM